jgi:hypothetical protein
MFLSWRFVEHAAHLVVLLFHVLADLLVELDNNAADLLVQLLEVAEPLAHFVAADDAEAPQNSILTSRREALNALITHAASGTRGPTGRDSVPRSGRGLRAGVLRGAS